MRTYKYYESISKISAVFATLLADGFYYLNTEDAALKEKISVIAVNSFISYFMAKNSVDLEVGLIDDKKNYQAIAYPLGAALLSTTQTIIAYREAESNSAILACSAAIATLLSNTTLYMNSLKGLAEFTQCDIIPRFRSATPEAWTSRKNTLRNLEILMERVRFSPYKEKDLAELTIELIGNETHSNALIRAALTLALSTKKVRYPKPSALKTIAKLTPQLAVAAIMVYGSFGYDCGVESALKKYFFSDSPPTAASLALLLMGCLFILNIKGAFMLVAAIINITASIINYGKLPNEFHLGDNLLKGLSYCSPILALMLTSFSGFTSKKLYVDNCNTSKLNFLQFPHAEDVIDYSTRTFNGTYAALAIIEGEKNYIAHSQHYEKDRAYLTMMNLLETLFQDLKKTPANQLQDVLEQLGPECVQLSDPFLFENDTQRNLEEARLLPGLN